MTNCNVFAQDILNFYCRSARHTQTKNQHMNLNNGDSQMFHAAIHFGYQHSTEESPMTPSMHCSTNK